jgi:hypothetical protein
VGGDYEAPFAFNGTIVRAEVTVTGPVLRDPVAEVAAILGDSVDVRAVIGQKAGGRHQGISESDAAPSGG